MDPASGIREIRLQPHQTTDALTATGDVFVIAHLGVPRVEAATWSLTIDGLVGKARSFSLDELKARRKTVVESVHQCCGSPMEPTVPTRRVTNVRWGGVDLAALLDELGVDAEARFLWSYGLDDGAFAGREVDWYRKDLPLARLAAGGVLLAYELNGEALPAEHGFPLRLVVPGYYGTNSVKWLWRMHLAHDRTRGLFASELYNDATSAEEVAAGEPARRPVRAIAPESIIVAPAPDAVIELGKPVQIRGWSWSFGGVSAVEVSVDDGGSFVRAGLEERRGFSWQRFSLAWQPERRGETMLSARAFEAGGAVQPADGARNAMHQVRVLVQ
jgi:DMSO/TMAO reductase YedYZ molybdopterin-dependent catalytic subunit